MKVLLITPPHTNPVGPTLGIAVLASHLKRVFSPSLVQVKAMDLGLDAMEWLLSEITISKAEKRLEGTICALEEESVLSYEEQCSYLNAKGALLVLRSMRGKVADAIKTIKSEVLYRNDLKRANANFIINKLLEAEGRAWPFTYLNAGDYRTERSPFSLDDIAAYVQKPEASIYNDFFDEWIESEELQSADILGISIAFAKQVLPAFLLARKIREACPAKKLVIGGSMMAHLNQEMFGPLFQWCDFVIQREGEYPLEHIIQKMLAGQQVSSEDGVLCINSEGKIEAAAPMPKVDLNKENVPDFSGFRLNDYFVPSANIPVQIGRSCYWGKCTFCCLNTAFVHKDSWTRAEKVADNLEILEKQYGVRTIEFVDDAILPTFAMQLSDLLIQRKSCLKWFGYARFDDKFTEDVFVKMHKAGCVGLKFGLESASPGVLKMMNKGIDIKKAAEIFRMARKAGIFPQAAFFLGFPGETRNDILKTLDFLEQTVIPNGIIAYNGVFRLLKSMPLLQEPEAYGIQKIEKWNTNEELIDYYTILRVDQMDVEKYAREVEAHLAPLIDKDLTRSVDLRRYWFAGYAEYGVKSDVVAQNETDFICTSPFALHQIKCRQDRNAGDFLPGKGIYKNKSYIARGLHSEEIKDLLNQTVPKLRKQNQKKYRLDVNQYCFSEV